MERAVLNTLVEGLLVRFIVHELRLDQALQQEESLLAELARAPRLLLRVPPRLEQSLEEGGLRPGNVQGTGIGPVPTGPGSG